MKKQGVTKKMPKSLGIPNSFPDKAKMLDEIEAAERQQNEARKTMLALKKAARQMPNGTMESFAQPFQAKVVTSNLPDPSKLTADEIKEAERLMEMTGEIE